MNYAKINPTDIANGPGVRVSLFVTGCRNRCKGCFNTSTWDFNNGELYSTVTLIQLLKYLEPDYISGLSILGGDPFEPENIDEVTKLCKYVKGKYPNKTIWVYTGYIYEDLKDLEIMNYIDVLVDGPFIESLKDISLVFKGSSNQRIIDIPNTLKTKQIILWKDED